MWRFVTHDERCSTAQTAAWSHSSDSSSLSGSFNSVTAYFLIGHCRYNASQVANASSKPALYAASLPYAQAMPNTAIAIAVLTVSDTRGGAEDTSGNLLAERLVAAGHTLVERRIVRDDIYAIRAVASAWIANAKVQAILATGGTGFSGRDSTPEALLPLFDKTITGFGELFRHVSFKEIGSSTIQSRAVGGLANGTLIFAMPGSTSACRTAWDNILREQLDAATQPCNFAELLPRFS